jgi:hypothetical protein
MGQRFTEEDLFYVVESIVQRPAQTVATTVFVAIVWIAMMYSLQN